MATARKCYEVTLARICGLASVRVDADEGTDHEELVAMAIRRAGDADVVWAFDKHFSDHGSLVTEREIRLIGRIA